MLCSLGYNRAVNLMDFCPGIFHTPGPLPCQPWMCATKITVFPVINRRHFQIVIMDICQHLLMRPVRHRAVSCYSLPVSINVISLSNIISVSSPPSKQQHIQFLLLVIFCLASMLDNLKPPCRKFAVLRKKHLQMVCQPFYILPCVDYGQFRRLMPLYPFCKCFILQITDYENAGGYPCPLANFTKYQGIVSTAPCIGGFLPFGFLLNLLYCLFDQLIQFFFCYQLLYFFKCIYPRSFLSAAFCQVHHPFRTPRFPLIAKATAPERITVKRLPAVL